MDWLPRAFVLLVIVMLGILAVDFIGMNQTFEKECWWCAYVRIHGEEPPVRWCCNHLSAGGNRLCPTCGKTWGDSEPSWSWVPWDRWTVWPFLFLLAAVPAFLSAARVARCPNCGGRPFLRTLWEQVPSTPCLRCGGRGRVTLLNRWWVLRPPPLRVRP